MSEAESSNGSHIISDVHLREPMASLKKRRRMRPHVPADIFSSTSIATNYVTIIMLLNAGTFCEQTGCHILLTTVLTVQNYFISCKVCRGHGRKFVLKKIIIRRWQTISHLPSKASEIPPEEIIYLTNYTDVKVKMAHKIFHSD